MWYKCLNPNCGYISHSTEGCDKCPDCGKHDLRKVTFDEQIAIANSKVRPPTEQKKPKNQPREIGGREH